jgi:transposase
MSKWNGHCIWPSNDPQDVFSHPTAGLYRELQVQLIGMGTYSGAQFLGRALREQGHEVRLMPAQYLKPYSQMNKCDYLDAEAITASSRESPSAP